MERNFPEKIIENLGYGCPFFLEILENAVPFATGVAENSNPVQTPNFS